MGIVKFQALSNERARLSNGEIFFLVTRQVLDKSQKFSKWRKYELKKASI